MLHRLHHPPGTGRPVGRRGFAQVQASMSETIETLRNGCRVVIRAIRPEDRADLLAAINRTSAQSRFRRFFGARGEFTERDIAFFVDVDFVKHVALVAVAEEDGAPVIIGGARYVITAPGTAEIAFAIIDEYQGQGLGTALMRHLVAIARAAGLRELIAEVLSENAPMLTVLAHSGLPISKTRTRDVVHVTLRLS
jgi:RimJ/RimL family protein N-acetyltransferase